MIESLDFSGLYDPICEMWKGEQAVQKDEVSNDEVGKGAELGGSNS